MKQPAIFFDRDNTLIVSDGYLGDSTKVKLIRGAAEAVARAHALGFRVVTVSNQSGVARGLFTEDAVNAVNDKMQELLLAGNPRAEIDHHEFCPFHPQAKLEQYRQDSDLRKPKPGMILRAAEELDLDLSASWVIGDAARDVEAGHAAGCRTILINDMSLSASPAAMEASLVEPDEIVTSLSEALDVIEAAVGTESLHQHSLDATRPAATSAELARIEHLLQAILDQARRRNEHVPEFSLGKMLAGVTQILAIALAVANYFYRPTAEPMTPLLIAIFLEVMTVALLVMGSQR